MGGGGGREGEREGEWEEEGKGGEERRSGEKKERSNHLHSPPKATTPTNPFTGEDW